MECIQDEADMDDVEPGEIVESDKNKIRDPWSAAGDGDMDSVLGWLAKYPGMDINEIDNVNRSILSEACFGGNRMLVSHLLALGANTNVSCSGSNYNTALSVAIMGNDPDIILLLLNHGANPGITNFRGDTAYHHAVLMPDSLELLLMQRPTVDIVNARNCANETPLDVARDLEIVRSCNLLRWYLGNLENQGNLTDAC